MDVSYAHNQIYIFYAQIYIYKYIYTRINIYLHVQICKQIQVYRYIKVYKRRNNDRNKNKAEKGENKSDIYCSLYYLISSYG